MHLCYHAVRHIMRYLDTLPVGMLEMMQYCVEPAPFLLYTSCFRREDSDSNIHWGLLCEPDSKAT